MYDHFPQALKCKTTRETAMLVSILHELGHLQTFDNGLDDDKEVLAWGLAKDILKAYPDVFGVISDAEWDLYVQDGLKSYENILGSAAIQQWKNALK
jgi:hypothetical protein